MPRTHSYRTKLEWSGNLGTGTSDYRAYSRNHLLTAEGKPAAIEGSSDATFRGDRTRYNPEELLVASISACHMLWVLHLCAQAGIVVTAYSDCATGIMAENPDGSGQFTSATLRPVLTLADSARCGELAHVHERAHEMCFISRSLNFPVSIEPEV